MILEVEAFVQKSKHPLRHGRLQLPVDAHVEFANVAVLEALEDYLLELGVDLEDVEFSMLSPEQAFLLLAECDNLRELPC